MLLAQHDDHRGGTLTSVCDNQGVLLREEYAAQDIRKGTHKEAEADLLLTLRDWAHQNPYKVRLQWVMKGHHDAAGETFTQRSYGRARGHSS